VAISLGKTVRGDDDLLVRVVQGVEDVEELLLRAFLARQELDIVDEQDVGSAGFLVEVLDDGIVVVRVLNRADNFVGELFARRVDNLLVGCLGQHGVRDALQQMSLSQPDAAVNIQWVVDVARVARDGVAGGEREAVARATTKLSNVYRLLRTMVLLCAACPGSGAASAGGSRTSTVMVVGTILSMVFDGSP